MGNLFFLVWYKYTMYLFTEENDNSGSVDSLGVVNGCSKVGVIDLPTLTPTMMNCSSCYWYIMTGEGRIKDC
jgi:hypothetical protein